MPHKRFDTSVSSARAAACRAWLRGEYLVERHLGKALAARPYWRSLLELYLAYTEQRSMFSSCLLTGETPSNVHRRSIRLAELGALTRRPDESDHRRMDLKLTPSVRAAIEAVLDTVITTHHGSDEGAGTTAPRRPHLYGEEPSADTEKVRIGEHGQIVLPEELCRSLELHKDDTVLIEVVDHEIRIRPAKTVLRQIQQRLRQFATSRGQVIEDLISARRAEALQA